MVDNPIQFAVVREDPSVEAALLEAAGRPRRALLIASGGCTALSLRARFPALDLTLVDVNAAQLDLVRRKAAALETADRRDFPRLFNVGDDSPAGLNACGNFESLFRGFRRLVHDLMAPAEALRAAFQDGSIGRLAAERIVPSRFWPAAFEMHFCDAFLNALFGPAATQHAPRGSYPGYFRAAIERGLMSPDAPRNYFLHHIFLGHYLDAPGALPEYLERPPRRLDFEYAHGTLADYAGAWDFDLVHLSNIFDWSEEDAVRATARLLCERLPRGARIVFRQLNNDTDFRRHFAGEFRFDEEAGEALLARDRSLFYRRIHVGVKS